MNNIVLLCQINFTANKSFRTLLPCYWDIIVYMQYSVAPLVRVFRNGFWKDK